jgi:hypothetical protein
MGGQRIPSFAAAFREPLTHARGRRTLPTDCVKDKTDGSVETNADRDAARWRQGE